MVYCLIQENEESKIFEMKYQSDNMETLFVTKLKHLKTEIDKCKKVNDISKDEKEKEKIQN